MTEAMEKLQERKDMTPEYGTEEFKIHAMYAGKINELQQHIVLLQEKLGNCEYILTIERKHQEHLMTIIQSLTV